MTALGARIATRPPGGAVVELRRLASRPDLRPLIVAIPVALGIVGAMAIGSDGLALAASGVSFVVAVLWPEAGLAVLAFMAPLKPPPVVPAPGFDLVLVAATCLGCLYRLPIDRPMIRPGAAFWLLAGYMLYVFAQQTPEMLTGWAPGPDHDVGYLFFQLLAGFGTIVAAGYVFSRGSPVAVLSMAIAGGLLAAVIAIGTFDAPAVGPPLAGLMAQAIDKTRAVGPFGNPNYMGAFVAISIAAIVGFLWSVRSPGVRAALLGVVGVLGIALALSLSRAAILAVLAGIACVSAWKSRRLAVALVVIAILGATFGYPLFVQWRLESLRGTADAAAYLAMSESDAGRLTGFLVGPQEFLSAPLFGVGFAHYQALSVAVGGAASPINSHNWYMEVLAEQGLIGVGLWIAFAIALVRSVRRLPKDRQAAAFGALGALAVAGLFLEAPTSFQTVAVPLLVVTAALAPGGSRPSAPPAGEADPIGSPADGTMWGTA